METTLGYTALALFVASIILWYISGRLLKKGNKPLSRRMVYIGGFLFSFALLSGLIAIAI